MQVPDALCAAVVAFCEEEHLAAHTFATDGGLRALPRPEAVRNFVPAVRRALMERAAEAGVWTPPEGKW